MKIIPTTRPAYPPAARHDPPPATVDAATEAATTAGPGGLAPAVVTDPAAPATQPEEALLRALADAVERGNDSIDELRDDVEDLTDLVEARLKGARRSAAAWVAVAVMWLAVTALGVAIVVEMPTAAWTRTDGPGWVIVFGYIAAAVAALGVARR